MFSQSSFYIIQSIKKHSTKSIKYLFKWLVISLVIGTLVGSASALFLFLLEWVTNYRENHSYLIFFLPIAGFIVGYIYYKWGKSIESGNNLLIENIHHPKEIIPFKMAPFVLFGTLMTHLFGGSAGREGTALQMAAAISDQFSKVFKLTDFERKSLIMAAISAGFGSVFGTPLAGTFFGLEIATRGKIAYKNLIPAILSAFIAHHVSLLWHTHHTKYSIFQVPEINLNFIFYTLISGVFFGIIALTFSLSLNQLTQFCKKICPFTPLRSFFGGLIVILLFLIVNDNRFLGLGIPTIQDSFVNNLPTTDFLLKMLFTIITLGTAYKGGEVTPLFFIGATAGNAISQFIPLPTSLLAGMGFVSVFSGATKTPIACILMGIELFGIESVAYTSIACTISFFISGKHSIYSSQL